MSNAINSYIDLPSHRNLHTWDIMHTLSTSLWSGCNPSVWAWRLKHAQLQTKFLRKGVCSWTLCDEKFTILSSTDYWAV